MEKRFFVRKQEILAECEVAPTLFEGMVERLQAFVAPFAACLTGSVQPQYAQDYVAGLVSNLESKNVESIAYFHDQDRRGLQRFIGEMPWGHKPMVRLLAEQVGHELGEADGVLVIDPSAFPKKGQASVGVQRQWCGRLGKVENCQVGVFLGYVSRREHALVGMRLYLPRSWIRQKKRCRECGVPEEEIRYRTRHELALEMLAESGPLLPHRWVAGDDEMGRPAHFRQSLRDLGERYLLAVPSNTLIRDLDGPIAAYTGRGRKPQPKWTRVDRWAAALPKAAWTRVAVRPGEKRPLAVEGVKARVRAKAEDGRPGSEETLVVLRSPEEDGSWKHDYHLSDAPFDTPLTEFARVAKAEHRIEECLQRAKSEAGLADYEVRNWVGWHHHQTLSLLATWFLVQETRRGKNTDPRAHGAAGPHGRRGPLTSRLAGRRHRPYDARLPAPFAANRGSQVLSLEKT